MGRNNLKKNLMSRRFVHSLSFKASMLKIPVVGLTPWRVCLAPPNLNDIVRAL